MLPDIHLNIIEAIGLEIDLNQGNKMHVFAIYLPGGSTNININRHFCNDIKQLTNRRISNFICGDFNARHRYWNCNRDNRSGILLYDYNRSNFAIVHPPTSTHFPTDPHKTPSTIDLLLTNGIHDYSHLACISLFSDHNAVEFSVHFNGNRNISHQQLIHNYKKANWNKFRNIVERNLLSQLPTSVTHTDVIDTLITTLFKAIKHAEKLSVLFTTWT